ncbi:MAG: thiamine phosphate synthase [Pyrinomonadaceae bacterium]|nr:thiamine phosphate synthase [Pyrinomonadaceae bacterium]
MKLDLPRLYPITDRKISGLSHAEQVVWLAAGGTTLVQLRDKHASPREFYQEAEAALRVARGLSVRLIVNDRADIALALGADGVHLGQDDPPPEAARRLLGDRAIIGYSTHNLAQAQEAALMPIDYLAIGPIYATATKANPDPIVGLDGLRHVREQLDPHLPLVAIGGITAANARHVLAAGADAVAVVGALLSEPTAIARRTVEFFSQL